VLSAKRAALWLEFEARDEASGEKRVQVVVFKSGEERLRQDMAVLHVLAVLERVWQDAALGVELTTYGCVATGSDRRLRGGGDAGGDAGGHCGAGRRRGGGAAGQVADGGGAHGPRGVQRGGGGVCEQLRGAVLRDVPARHRHAQRRRGDGAAERAHVSRRFRLDSGSRAVERVEQWW
jgi:hypothetical protein